jgi:hypothetical protein
VWTGASGPAGLAVDSTTFYWTLPNASTPASGVVYAFTP